MSFLMLCIIGLLFGIGFGYFIQRAGFCIAAGFGEVFIGKGRRILRMLIIIFIITSIGFLISGYINPELGLKKVGQIRAFGFLNIISGLFFGAGIILCGGCILGTLRQIGEGNTTFLISLVSFIPGMALVVYLINPVLNKYYFVELSDGSIVKNLLLTDIFDVKGFYITVPLVILALLWYFIIRKK